jgi:c(7)-type cytochrome triheme protein
VKTLNENLAYATRYWVLAAMLGALPLGSGIQAQEHPGLELYSIKCAPCHQSGLLGAPKLGDAAAWKARVAKGRDELLKNIIKGVNNMPPRGGNPSMSDEDVGKALDYMLSMAAKAPSAAAKAASPAPAEAKVKAKAVPKPASAPTQAAPKPKPARKKRQLSAQTSGVNTFNRLMKPPSERNPPPAKDGIHDPDNEGTHILQPPKDAFGVLPKGISGNRVDWVKALDEGKIAPRYELEDTGKAPVVMDLDIVREVKGSMPDVVYPHEQHTKWLDCSNCHPAIFVPQKGANKMSMAGILLGKQCGVCHGKVAFPVADCRKCHSRKKPKAGN